MGYMTAGLRELLLRFEGHVMAKHCFSLCTIVILTIILECPNHMLTKKRCGACKANGHTSNSANPSDPRMVPLVYSAF